MSKKDPRIDAYIAKSSAFAKPILTHLRKLIHESNPDIVENLKWGMPSFEYKGLLCSFAAFKEHCAFSLWKAKLMKDSKNFSEKNENAMGILGRITSAKDLPADKKIIAYIKEAVLLNEKGVKAQIPKSKIQKELVIPDYFLSAVKKNKKAWTTFEQFSYSNRKDYVEWVTEAKTDSTRDERLKTSVLWMSEGKIRNWKYARKK